MWGPSLSFSPQDTHDADRAHQDPAAEAAATPLRASSRAYTPCAHRRAANLPRGRRESALPRAHAHHPARRGRIRSILSRGAFPLSLSSLSSLRPHTERKTQYEGTLRFFAPPAPPDEATATPPARPWAPLLLAGGVAGILGWIVTFPFDVLKTRMQAVDIPGTSTGTGTGTGAGSRASNTSSAISQRPFPPPGTWRTARTMYAEPDGGPRIFWRGLMPTIIRAVPVNMAVFGTFEAVVWAFS